jgi:hypothetical protein
MKLFTTWVVSAGLVLAATAADAQVLTPRGAGSAGYAAVSDVDGPYAAVPEGAPLPGYGPTLLPAPEVYTVLRENGFSPLGAPQLRGVVYTIAVIDRRGDDGRLVINARNGRIIRFMPGYRRGGNLNDDLSMTDGPAGSLPPVSQVRGVPRPPLSIPRVASRTPMPKASPPRSAEPAPLAAQPAPEPPVQRSAATQPKPADAQAAVPAAAAPAAVEAKPAPQIQPTQPMPKAQGLD